MPKSWSGTNPCISVKIYWWNSSAHHKHSEFIFMPKEAEWLLPLGSKTHAGIRANVLVGE